MNSWYRYVDYDIARPVDEWGYSVGSGRVAITLIDLPIVKTTAKGVWLGWEGSARFVLRDARKRYACPTREEAWESFLARKKKQLKILTRQKSSVKDVLALAERGRPEFDKGVETLNLEEALK